MILVDSSVWLTALSPSDPAAFKARIQLEELLDLYMVSICDAVRFDVLQRVQPAQRATFLSYFNQLPLLPAKAASWNIAVQVAWEMQHLELTLTQSEAIVVALALQNQMPLFTLSETQVQVTRIRRLRILQ